MCRLRTWTSRYTIRQCVRKGLRGMRSCLASRPVGQRVVEAVLPKHRISGEKKFQKIGLTGFTQAKRQGQLGRRAHERPMTRAARMARPEEPWLFRFFILYTTLYAGFGVASPFLPI